MQQNLLLHPRNRRKEEKPRETKRHPQRAQEADQKLLRLQRGRPPQPQVQQLNRKHQKENSLKPHHSLRLAEYTHQDVTEYSVPQLEDVL